MLLKVNFKLKSFIQIDRHRYFQHVVFDHFEFYRRTVQRHRAGAFAGAQYEDSAQFDRLRARVYDLWRQRVSRKAEICQQILFPWYRVQADPVVPE